MIRLCYFIATNVVSGLVCRWQTKCKQQLTGMADVSALGVCIAPHLGIQSGLIVANKIKNNQPVAVALAVHHWLFSCLRWCTSKIQWLHSFVWCHKQWHRNHCRWVWHCGITLPQKCLHSTSNGIGMDTNKCAIAVSQLGNCSAVMLALALALAMLQSSSCNATTTHLFAMIPMPSFVMSNVDSFVAMHTVAAGTALGTLGLCGTLQNCGDFAMAIF